MSDDLTERLDALAEAVLDTRVAYVDEITMASLLREAATRIRVQRAEVVGLVGMVTERCARIEALEAELAAARQSNPLTARFSEREVPAVFDDDFDATGSSTPLEPGGDA